ncbi:dihydropteroate synthase [Aliidiomarina minuta]|uniref:Dihydropteroate synthase n=1 Tax=Aliidiomarina minuta TaxID=880057 RepID=A0A432W5C0_9GAMM|nr:dihydropteroate synthase [Aliidiomarina minuta]RUO25260.1 dihydropteroate synthase [Aliidiomarina minuta]
MHGSTAMTEVMGILNVTPDSFSDGGNFNTLDKALFQAERMLSEGATWLDVGGESTRPGASAVSLEEELERVIPVIKSITERFAVSVSVDTSKPQVMTAAVAAGASMINDVNALRSEGALAAAAATQAQVCLMHMQGEPRSMQRNPSYTDVLGEVKDFLQQRVTACEQAGIQRSQILLDPGFGFGKSVQHNYQLLQRLPELQELGLPLLVGLSRKSMLGKVTGAEVSQRLAASVAAATIAAMKGARIVRVHDVRATVEAMQVVCATLQEEY